MSRASSKIGTPAPSAFEAKVERGLEVIEGQVGAAHPPSYDGRAVAYRS
jgi:hypothetical protein